MKKLTLKSWFYQLVPLLLWTVFAVLPFLFRINDSNFAQHRFFLREMLYKNILNLVVFYGHTYLIYPFLKKKNGLIWYTICLLACFTVYIVIAEHLRPSPQDFARMNPQIGAGFPKPPPINIFFSVPAFIITILVSFCYSILTNTNRREKSLKDRENNQLKAELNFLRSQISPHFMFNVLNSMVSLARKKSELLEPSLINMSNLMRYMLYERTDKLVSLKTEVEYLQNYTDLQLLRYGDTVQLNMYITGNLEGYSIEPMLLIPFVENAFKHGISMIDEPLIDVFLTVDPETGTLQFVVFNNISPVKDMQEGGTGIGLQNVQRRLELLYPGKHKLNITNQKSVFKAEIRIKLS